MGKGRCKAWKDLIPRFPRFHYSKHRLPGTDFNPARGVQSIPPVILHRRHYWESCNLAEVLYGRSWYGDYTGGWVWLWKYGEPLHNGDKDKSFSSYTLPISSELRAIHM